MHQIMRLSQQSAYRIGIMQPLLNLYDTAELPSV
jgi:hypothetical protein